jgi:hypothetical protein
MEDEVTGRIIRIFTEFDKTHLTKYTYVKGAPSYQSGFILEDGKRIKLPLNEYVECIRNNFIITSNYDKIEYKTVFTLCKIEVNNNNFELNLIDTLISDGDCSMAVFLNNDRIMIQEAQEGGVETHIQLYDIELDMIRQIKPFMNYNVSGSSQAVFENTLYYSVEPDEQNEFGLPLPKIMMINIQTGEIIAEKIIINTEYALQLEIFNNIIIGSSNNRLEGYDLNLNVIWRIDNIKSSSTAFNRKDNLLIISTLNKVTAIYIKDGSIIWEKTIREFFANVKDIFCEDMDYKSRIFQMKGFKDNDLITVIGGGYLINTKRMNNKPIICDTELFLIDKNGKINAHFPIDFNERKPLLISKKKGNNQITVSLTGESLYITTNENN